MPVISNILILLSRVFSWPLFFSSSDEGVAKEGDLDERFNKVYNDWVDKIYQFFFFRLRSEADAEDLTAITFERVYKNLHKYEDRGFKISAWIFTIARNLLIDHLKKNSAQIDSIDDLPVSKEPAEQFNMMEFDRNLLKDQLWEAINELPDKQQMVWSLKLSKDLSHKDIAEVMGINENHVNVLLHRSGKILRQRLSHLYYE